VRVPRALGYGIVRFLVGCGLLVLAVLVARPAIPSLRAFTFVETGMLIAALLVEQFVGPDLRRNLRRRARVVRS